MEPSMAETPTIREIGDRALSEVSDLIGCPAEGVVGVSRDDGGWVVSIEVLEVGRVPETTDVLGRYDVQMDEDGNVMGYQRVGRYLRSSVES